MRKQVMKYYYHNADSYPSTCNWLTTQTAHIFINLAALIADLFRFKSLSQTTVIDRTLTLHQHFTNRG
jgi:hypothetical protein